MTGLRFNAIIALICCFAFPLFLTAQIKYGVQFNLNGSSIFDPSKDSFNSDINWGGSFFFEYPLSHKLAIQMQYAYNQINYSKESDFITFKSSNIDIPVDLIYAPPAMNKTWLSFGLVASRQLSKYRSELKGSSSNGKATFLQKEDYTYDLGLKTGIGFEITNGLGFNLSYYHFILNDYKKNNITGRPSHWQLSAQIRFDEIKFNRKIPNRANADSLRSGTLVVLLPIKDLIRTGKYIDSLDWADRAFFNQLLVTTFRNHYTFSKVLFCYDSSLNYLRTGKAVFIDENLQVAAETGLSGFYLITGPMEYFVATNENSKKGLFLFDARMQLIREPFLGYFKLNMNKSDDELETEIYNAVGKLNRALLEYK